MATLVVAAIIAAVAAGASAYMASEAQADAAKQQRKMADWQAQVEAEQAEVARKQSRLKAQRMLNAQASKAGGAGVSAGEGSLLANQIEAASLAQFEEDLAAYGHELSSETHRFESRLFKARQKQIERTQWIGVGLSVAGSAANSYMSYSTSRPRGQTIATGGGSGIGSGSGQYGGFEG